MIRYTFIFIFITVIVQAQQDSIRLWSNDTSFKMQKVYYPDSILPAFGKKIAYYDSAYTKKAAEFNFMNGKVYGLYKAYYENGTLMEYGVMYNGVFHGDWTLQDEFGSISIKGKYKYGIKHGYWALRYKNCFGRYKNGVQHGTWKCYEDGQLISRTHYKNGVLEKTPPPPGNSEME